jgi:hypothetical protein
MKFGAFVACPICGVKPATDDDLVLSLMMTDHYFDIATMQQMGQAIRDGRPPHLEESTRANLLEELSNLRKTPVGKLMGGAHVQSEATHSAEVSRRAEVGLSRASRQAAIDDQEVLATIRARAEKYGNWLRQHPRPTIFNQSQWRDALLFWNSSMRALNDESAEWKENFGKLLDVGDHYPVGLGLGALLPRGREAITNWKRLSKKYLGIDVP